MPEVEKTELKRRVRAAWSYSLLEQGELAELMEVSAASLRGWLRKEGPRVPLATALSLADACQVPRAFILDGWAFETAQLATDPALEARIAAIESKLRMGS